MTNKQKVKGSLWERICAGFMQSNGHPHCERSYGAGRPDDCGDLEHPLFAIECKDHKTLLFGPWLDEVERERLNSHRPFGVVFAKRKGKGVDQGFAVMTIATFAELTKDL